MIFNYCFSSSYLVSSVIFSPDFSLAIKNTTETFCTRFSVTYCNQVSLTPCLSLKASARKEKFHEITKIDLSETKNCHFSPIVECTITNKLQFSKWALEGFIENVSSSGFM